MNSPFISLIVVKDNNISNCSIALIDKFILLMLSSVITFLYLDKINEFNGNNPLIIKLEIKLTLNESNEDRLANLSMLSFPSLMSFLSFI